MSDHARVAPAGSTWWVPAATPSRTDSGWPVQGSRTRTSNPRQPPPYEAKVQQDGSSAGSQVRLSPLRGRGVEHPAATVGQGGGDQELRHAPAPGVREPAEVVLDPVDHRDRPDERVTLGSDPRLTERVHVDLTGRQVDRCVAVQPDGHVGLPQERQVPPPGVGDPVVGAQLGSVAQHQTLGHRDRRDAGGDGELQHHLVGALHDLADHPRHRPQLAVVRHRLTGQDLRLVVGEQLVPTAEEHVVVAGPERHRTDRHPVVAPQQLGVGRLVHQADDLAAQPGQQHGAQVAVLQHHRRLRGQRPLGADPHRAG